MGSAEQFENSIPNRINCAPRLDVINIFSSPIFNANCSTRMPISFSFFFIDIEKNIRRHWHTLISLKCSNRNSYRLPIPPRTFYKYLKQVSFTIPFDNQRMYSPLKIYIYIYIWFFDSLRIRIYFSTITSKSQNLLTKLARIKHQHRTIK